MIVIPMAGDSRRFRDAGYETPKYMLALHGRPLFDWTLLSFASEFRREDFLFVARDGYDTYHFLRTRLAVLGIAKADIVMLAAPTLGQADTVAQGLMRQGVPQTEPLCIFNIDTIRPGVNISPMRDAAGWLEVFRAQGEHWSFIEPDRQDPKWVRRCSEKQRISDLCSTGLYFFSSASLFFDALSAERRNPSSCELFVAPLYNHLVAAGLKVGWREVPCDRVILSGVPGEYEALKSPSFAASLVPLAP